LPVPEPTDRAKEVGSRETPEHETPNAELRADIVRKWRGGYGTT
jgi:hypothetical protein